MLPLITINQIDFQIINKLPRKKFHDKEIIEASKGRNGVWKTSLNKYILTIETLPKVLSELKNLKHQWLLLGAPSQQWKFHPP